MCLRGFSEFQAEIRRVVTSLRLLLIFFLRCQSPSRASSMVLFLFVVVVVAMFSINETIGSDKVKKQTKLNNRQTI
jgi:hypothetical protein